MMVFATLQPEQIDLSKTGAPGVAALRAFLEYAGGMELPQTKDSIRSAGHEGVAAAICAELEKHGWQTGRQVGHSEYRIDIGVVDPENPERYLLGVLLDSEPYKNAKTARDRELAQTGVLTGLGWRILRVWTVDWWENREKEVERILTALKKSPDGESGDTPAAAPENPPAEEAAPPAEEAAPVPADEITEEPALLSKNFSLPAEPDPAKPYRAAQLPVKHMSAEDFLLEENFPAICDRVQQIVSAEAPISEALLSRRVLHSCGLSRGGSRMQQILREACSALRLTLSEQDGQTVCWLPEQSPDGYALYRTSGEGADRRDAKDVPAQEAANAAVHALRLQLNLTHEDLIREGAKLLGYPRPGSIVNAMMEAGIRRAESSGRIEKNANGKWVPANE